MGLSDKRNLDKFKGCLVGGAIGDALGFPVEFYGIDEIFSEYGRNGIREYDYKHGKALISDDTQMTLFTANGLLSGTAYEKTTGVKVNYPSAIWGCYKDWLKTQCGMEIVPDPVSSWLINVRGLHMRRAPGNTCISSLMGDCGGTFKAPVNDSKGCGGIMRVAPVALYFIDKNYARSEIDKMAAEAAALTHGHELGYIPAAALAHIIYSEASGEYNLTGNGVRESVKAVKALFPNSVYMNKLEELIDFAIKLSATNTSDTEAIGRIGEGWVAEETLAIAVYCALKYRDDFERAIIASVNHSGDSDSTGAVTGNILGARLGLKNIPDRFVKGLEIEPLIEEIAEDLFTYYSDDKKWRSKYIDCDYGFGYDGN